MQKKEQPEKCVLVLDETLPLGLAANTAAILGITLGRRRPDLVGHDVTDGSGGLHPGIVTLPVPVLRGDRSLLSRLRQRLSQPEFGDLGAADFSALAQGCKTYGEFTEKMGQTPEPALGYLGLAIWGDRRQVDRLTGSLPLLR